jgi:hypothetical protein
VALALAFFSVSCSSAPVHAIETDEKMSAPPEKNAAHDHYGLRSTHQKLIDNRGEGYDALYGVRNLRVILADIAYRGGANNRYNRYGVRDNRNPLPTIGLENLCRDGFDTAVYLYSTNFAGAPKKVDCIDRRTQKPNSLVYLQFSPYNEKSLREVLSLIYRKSQTPGAGSAFFHCWNGWHASGLVSAYILRQFCDATGDEAVAYWDLNTDGNHSDPAFAKLRQSIRNFVPYSDFRLEPTQKEALCLPFQARRRP